MIDLYSQVCFLARTAACVVSGENLIGPVPHITASVEASKVKDSVLKSSLRMMDLVSLLVFTSLMVRLAIRELAVRLERQLPS
jgi:hypothetical protein